MRTILAATIISFCGALAPAWAMMPSLTDQPRPATLQSCQKWAASQDEEARYLWGLLENGKFSTDVGVLRLALVCLGDTVPDIVTFSSSVGSADQYCRSHPRVQICRGRR